MQSTDISAPAEIVEIIQSPVSANNPLKNIAAIALNTFREAVRDRILYSLVLFVLLLTAAAVVLGDLTAGQEARTVVNLGLSAMLLFGAFISIFVGVALVSKEIERRTVHAILAKPVSRVQFVIGKYLGLCLTLLINVIVMGAGVSLALLWVGSPSLAATVWGAVFLIFFELTILTAVAILFSSFSTPALSALLTFFVFIIGHFSSTLNELGKNLGSQFAKYLFAAIYYVFPNLAHYSFITNAAHGDIPPPAMVLGAVAYALVYVAIVLTITAMVFSRRNFK